MNPLEKFDDPDEMTYGELSKFLMITSFDEKKVDASMMRDIKAQGMYEPFGGKNLCYGVNFIQISEDKIAEDPNNIKNVLFMIETIEVFEVKYA
jgi:hypothetical protein